MTGYTLFIIAIAIINAKQTAAYHKELLHELCLAPSQYSVYQRYYFHETSHQYCVFAGDPVFMIPVVYLFIYQSMLAHALIL